MAPVEQLDTKYGATKQEREYVQEMLEKKEGVIGLFKKELNKLNTKIIRNFHSDNFVAFEAQKKFETE
ncbi:TPA: hypothetical protein DCZ39_00585, partial [Patescibacteria group bacterium]|nr:hypothetical protein [Candidatus Gracilibacteria bacterium]